MKAYQVTWIEHHSKFVEAEDEDAIMDMCITAESNTRVDYDEVQIAECEPEGGAE